MELLAGEDDVLVDHVELVLGADPLQQLVLAVAQSHHHDIFPQIVVLVNNGIHCTNITKEFFLVELFKLVFVGSVRCCGWLEAMQFDGGA